MSVCLKKINMLRRRFIMKNTLTHFEVIQSSSQWGLCVFWLGVVFSGPFVDVLSYTQASVAHLSIQGEDPSYVAYLRFLRIFPC